MISPSIEPYSPNLIWLVVVGYIIAFILAFGIGANDCANSFGTSVGAKVLTIKQACILATIFEIAGASLIGYTVSDTIRKGILDLSQYKNQELDLMLGCISALSASAVWLILATFLNMPISGTHSIVGATVGFSLAVKGLNGIQWIQILKIGSSWFISPVLSGLISSLIYLFIYYAILIRKNPTEAGLLCLPFFYGFTAIVNIFSIVHNGPRLLYMDNLPFWLAVVISLSAGFVIMALVQLFLVPWQRKVMKKRRASAQVNFSIGESADPTPNASPSKMNNRLSQLSNDDKQLSVISECAEMLPLSPNETTTKNIKYTFCENSVTPSKCVKCNQDQLYCKCKETSNNIVPKTQQNLENNKKKDSTTAQKHIKLLENETTTLMTPNTSTMLLISDKKTSASSATLQNDNQILDSSHANGNHNTQPNHPFEEIEATQQPEVTRLFSFLQIMTAIFGSFAHGGNDVSNAIGPLIALWLIYTEGTVEQKSETPIFILLYGGLGITAGLWILGRRVIQTVGTDLTKITPTTGFSIELGSAFTVLLASKIGIPISTTHCKVGSVVFVGMASAVTTKVGSPTKVVDMGLFRNIIYAWIITVPMTAALSAGCMVALRSIAYSF
ncbi:sodium-dependent phosphate transporter 1 [Chrysoperla carnea]|uniref:sodium-dependent phosphate transporter 1 n=1 Tax=Chrysoperla carnea TaxID=189513 RepID=UPI001D089E07|nr:sodium-dependent phosphate transporter 1 [Chrysoperla carnea]